MMMKDENEVSAPMRLAGGGVGGKTQETLNKENKSQYKTNAECNVET